MNDRSPRPKKLIIYYHNFKAHVRVPVTTLTVKADFGEPVINSITLSTPTDTEPAHWVVTNCSLPPGRG